jgi:hypothetical protein
MLYATLLAYALWVLYLLVMGLYRAQLAGRLSKPAMVLGAPFLILGYLVDVLTNLTVATALFLELPREALVTTRLTRHMGDGDGWRYRVARAICRSLLDPFDPRGVHCQES